MKLRNIKLTQEQIDRYQTITIEPFSRKLHWILLTEQITKLVKEESIVNRFSYFYNHSLLNYIANILYVEPGIVSHYDYNDRFSFTIRKTFHRADIFHINNWLDNEIENKIVDYFSYNTGHCNHIVDLKLDNYHFALAGEIVFDLIETQEKYNFKFNRNCKDLGRIKVFLNRRLDNNKIMLFRRNNDYFSLPFHLLFSEDMINENLNDNHIALSFKFLIGHNNLTNTVVISNA